MPWDATTTGAAQTGSSSWGASSNATGRCCHPRRKTRGVASLRRSAPILSTPGGQRRASAGGQTPLLLNGSAGSSSFRGAAGQPAAARRCPWWRKSGAAGAWPASTSAPLGYRSSPYVVDGRRCISHLYHRRTTAPSGRVQPLMATASMAADDCQLICSGTATRMRAPEPDRARPTSP